tara:strand:+ start:58 stop:945 length:888 start_codon:yes stop_codon:yes gene_type:complete
MNAKGIILAAGKGTRLTPATLPVSKPFLPIYDKPMIYYPLETLIRLNVKDILFIVHEDDLVVFQNTFGSGKHVGLNFSYIIQKKQKGIADAYIIAEKFLEESPSILALCDNVFIGEKFIHFAEMAHKKIKNGGCSIFGLSVPDPENFGVIELDEDGKITRIEEKPSKPKTNLVIPGMYFFDSEAKNYVKELNLSPRGELEITDLIKIYLKNQNLDLEILDDSIIWHDAGNAKSLLDASQNVKKYEIENHVKVGSYEIAAFEKGFIDISDLNNLAEKFIKSDYGKTIKRYIDNLNN